MTTTTDGVSDPGRGREATTPSEMTWPGWKDILWRVYSEFSEDRVTLIAAGATFYLLLALFPALAAFVSIYGVVADPQTIADHVAFLGGVLPSGGLELIQSQLQSLISQDPSSLSFGFLFGLALALYSANNGILTLFEAMNIAYDEAEKRGFVMRYAISLLFTLGAIIIGILFIVSVGVVPAVLAFVGLGTVAETLISLARWPILFAASAAAIAVLYRYGPSRERAKWRWVTWGSVLATIVWIIASVLFSWYLTNFADYNATYGSLGAVIGFMMWTWISVIILIFGAELNSEMEHQTARDSTTGPEKPLGARGATMADNVGKSSDDPAAKAEAERGKAEPLRFPGQSAGKKSEPVRRPRSTESPSRAGSIAAILLPIAALGGRLFGSRRRRS
ncbi:MAG: YihY/virulence factor BrkB family protein [Rhizobiales bacterium]|nr:YihY/virulence factor BrkB family protein [Hyphomicrobiales bacterium]